MKYAFFPGCVSRGGCPELYPSSIQVCERLGLELEVMEGASCTGAGVLQEKNQMMGGGVDVRKVDGQFCLLLLRYVSIILMIGSTSILHMDSTYL